MSQEVEKDIIPAPTEAAPATASTTGQASQSTSQTATSATPRKTEEQQTDEGGHTPKKKKAKQSKTTSLIQTSVVQQWKEDDICVMKCSSILIDHSQSQGQTRGIDQGHVNSMIHYAKTTPPIELETVVCWRNEGMRPSLVHSRVPVSRTHGKLTSTSNR